MCRSTSTMLACVLLAVAPLSSSGAILSWTSGSGTIGWGTAANWSTGTPPTVNDIVTFDNAGSSFLPYQPTSMLDISRTIAGLNYSVGNAYHTTDLNGRTLTVTGNLAFNIDQPAPTLSALRNGVLSVTGPNANFFVGSSILNSAWSVADLSGLSSVSANVQQFKVGARVLGSAFGELTLPISASITSPDVTIGSNGTGRVHFGVNTTVSTDRLVIGEGQAIASADALPDGVFNLGSDQRFAQLLVGAGSNSQGTQSVASLSLPGSTVSAWLNRLVVGQKDSTPGFQTATFTAGAGGSMVVGESGNPADVIVGDLATGTLDLRNMTSFTANLNRMAIGTSIPNPGNNTKAQGTVNLPQTVSIDALSIVVGDDGDTISTLGLGGTNSLSMDLLDLGRNESGGRITVVPGGATSIGSAARPTTLRIATGATDNGRPYTSSLDLTGTDAELSLQQLIVGQKNLATSATQTASLIGGSSGTVVIGSASNLGSLVVGDLRSSALVDLSLMDSFSANVDQLVVGRNGSGILRLPGQVDIDAGSIVVGQDGELTGNILMGQTNAVMTDQWSIGRDYGTGIVTVPAGGSLSLGSDSRRTQLLIGKGVTTHLNGSHDGTLDLTGATFNAYLSDLIVGQKDSSSGRQDGALTGGVAGTIDLRGSGRSANLIVGDTRANGDVDLSQMDQFDAYIDQMRVGVGPGGSGTLRLAQSNTIDALRIVIGDDSIGASVQLGAQNTILAESLEIGNNNTTATVTIVPNGEVQLGSALRPMALIVGQGITDHLNGSFGGTLDLSGASVQMNLTNLTVGRKDPRNGAQFGNLQGGSTGDVVIGTAAAPGTVIIGDTRSTGTVDLHQMDSLTAYLDTMEVGIHGATGNLQLPRETEITANRLSLGNDGESQVTLGQATTLVADALEVGLHFGHGTVLAPSGSTLALGIPQRWMDLTIALGVTNHQNGSFGGTLDLRGAVTTAYLDEVVIGDKDPQQGLMVGSMLLSDGDNDVRARSIFLGGQNSRGTLDFAGGTLTADAITRGIGIATFNWTGGELRVGAFGSPAAAFDLSNQGTGTLSPGTTDSAAYATSVFGNYSQGSGAALRIELGGIMAGTEFDQLSVSGTANLSGSLSVYAISAFVPVPGTSFLVLTSSGRSGQFTEILNETGFEGLTFSTTYSQTSVTLNVSAALAADANLDGIISGADYTIWADHFGMSDATYLVGDFNGDALVSGADYTIWSDHFGEHVSPAISTSIPEPASWAMTVVATLGIAVWARWRRK